MTKKENNEYMFEALSALETDLIALKDVMDVVKLVPIENPTPVYLIRRIAVHTEELSQSFRHAWNTILKKR